MIDVEGQRGFENVAMSQTTGHRRIRAEISINHTENYWKYLKKQLPPHLTYDAYVQDSDAWLYSACWRARVMRDPYLALGRLLQDEPEDEEQMWSSGDEEEAGEDEEESDDEDE